MPHFWWFSARCPWCGSQALPIKNSLDFIAFWRKGKICYFVVPVMPLMTVLHLNVLVGSSVLPFWPTIPHLTVYVHLRYQSCWLCAVFDCYTFICAINLVNCAMFDCWTAVLLQSGSSCMWSICWQKNTQLGRHGSSLLLESTPCAIYGCVALYFCYTTIYCTRGTSQ